MENVAKLMEKANREYYAGRGKHIYHDFKTFSGCAKLGKACALEFLERAQKAELAEFRVYEVGVGDGSFALNFLRAVERIDPTIAKKVVYVLWDMSAKMLELAEGKLGDFAVEKVHADAEEVGRMKDAFWVRGNEVLDDIPARVFLRKGEKAYEVGMNNLEWCAEECTSPPKGVREYMEGVPEGYWVPLNLRAAKMAGGWEVQEGGGISMLDYGFPGLDEARGIPPEVWNDSVVREYGAQSEGDGKNRLQTVGEYTVDVNFDFLVNAVGGKVEAQDEFVNKRVGKGLFAVEKGEGMRYMDSAEIEAERGKLEKEGYDIDILKGGNERNPYYHYSISV